jgi:hypothetical protein
MERFDFDDDYTDDNEGLMQFNFFKSLKVVSDLMFEPDSMKEKRRRRFQMLSSEALEDVDEVAKRYQKGKENTELDRIDNMLQDGIFNVTLSKEMNKKLIRR